MLHRERLLSVTRNVTSDHPIPIFTDFLEPINAKFREFPF
jgi:hypothetical protein